jgi:hypothetical protein
MAICFAYDGDHGPGKLMPQNDVRRVRNETPEGVLSPRVLAEEVTKVGTAHPTRRHFDEDHIGIAVIREGPHRNVLDNEPSRCL